MSEKNQTHLAIDPDDSHSWSFVVPSDAETAEEQFEEMTEFAADVLDAGGDFLRPREVVATRRSYAEKYEFPFGEVLPQGTERVPVESEGTVTSDDLDADALREDPPELLIRVSSERTEVEVELADGTRYLDRSEDCVPYRDGEAQDWEPNDDPLEFKITHSSNGEAVDGEATHIYSVSVTAHGTIWFESSELGDANRERLSAYLQRLDDVLDPEVVRRSSKRFSESELADVF